MDLSTCLDSDRRSPRLVSPRSVGASQWTASFLVSRVCYIYPRSPSPRTTLVLGSTYEQIPSPMLLQDLRQRIQKSIPKRFNKDPLPSQPRAGVSLSPYSVTIRLRSPQNRICRASSTSQFPSQEHSLTTIRPEWP